MKVCSTCKVKKTKNDFYKRPGTRDGLHYVCKECIGIKQKEVREKHKKEHEENKLKQVKVFPEKKMCNLCFNIKPIDDFYRNRTMLDGRQYYCKACELDLKKVYYERKRAERKGELVCQKN